MHAITSFWTASIDRQLVVLEKHVYDVKDIVRERWSMRLTERIARISISPCHTQALTLTADSLGRPLHLFVSDRRSGTSKHVQLQGIVIESAKWFDRSTICILGSKSDGLYALYLYSLKRSKATCISAGKHFESLLIRTLEGREKFQVTETLQLHNELQLPIGEWSGIEPLWVRFFGKFGGNGVGAVQSDRPVGVCMVGKGNQNGLAVINKSNVKFVSLPMSYRSEQISVKNGVAVMRASDRTIRMFRIGKDIEPIVVGMADIVCD